MSSDTALVTGGAGFIGANLVRRLLHESVRVVAPIRAETDLWRLAEVAGEVEMPTLDLRDPQQVASVVSACSPRWMFHLAAYGGSSWQVDESEMIAINVAGTAALLRSFDGELMIHAGSSSEYGIKDHPAREDELLLPNSSYAVTKAAATHFCALHDDPAGTRTMTLRLYSIYGPWEGPRRLLPTLVGHALRNELPPLTNPDTARDFVFVDDACDAFLSAMGRVGSLPPGVVLNVASGMQTSLGEVVETAREVFGVTVEARWGHMEDRAWDAPTWVGDPRHAAEVLGWRASTDLAEGMRATSTWLSGKPE